MSEKNKEVDQFGTYSKNVGEWTTGSGGGAGTEATHIHPANAVSTADDAADETNDITTGGSRDFEQQDVAGASDHQV